MICRRAGPSSRMCYAPRAAESRRTGCISVFPQIVPVDFHKFCCLFFLFPPQVPLAAGSKMRYSLCKPKFPLVLKKFCEVSLMGTTPRTPASVFAWNGVPPAGQLIPLGLQHVVAAVVGVITPAIIVSSTCGLSDADTTLMIQVSLILTALATLLQLFPLFRRLGSGLPVIMASALPTFPRSPPSAAHSAWGPSWAPRSRAAAWPFSLGSF